MPRASTTAGCTSSARCTASASVSCRTCCTCCAAATGTSAKGASAAGGRGGDCRILLVLLTRAVGPTTLMLEACDKVAVAALLRRGQLRVDLPMDRGTERVDAGMDQVPERIHFRAMALEDGADGVLLRR